MNLQTRSLDGVNEELGGYAIIGNPQQNDILIFQNGYWVYATLSQSGSIIGVSNVGTGVGLFRDIISGVAFFKSLTSNNINIVNSGNDVNLSVDADQPDIRSITSATNVFTLNPSTINFPNIGIGTGNPSFVLGWGSGGSVQKYDFAGINGITDITNVGAGSQVLKDIVSNVASLRSLVGDPNIGVFQNTNTINFTLSNVLTGISEIAGTTLNLGYSVITLPYVPAITPTYSLGLDSFGKIGYFTDTESGVQSISNLGIGQALFSNLTGGVAYFRSLADGTNINLTGDANNVYVNLNSNISVNQLTATQLNAPLLLNGFGTGTPNFYLASDSGNNLILASPPSSTNIYNSNGTLTGNRTLNGSFSLTLNPSSIAMPTANISMAGLANNPSPASWVSMDGSGNLSKSSLPPSTNIYNSDGFLPANRLMLGNGFNLTFDDTNVILPNNVNYVPENNNSIEYKYLVFDSSGNSKMVYCPNNSLSRLITIGPLGGLNGACNFLILTNVIGGGAPPSFMIDFYLNDNSFASNSSAMHWSFCATLNTFNGTGPMVIMPNHSVATTTGYPLYLLQAQYVTPNTLYFYLINMSANASSSNLTMRVIGRGIGAGNTASMPLTYSTLSPSASIMPESLRMYFQGNSGVGNIANWIWFYGMFPRNVKLTVWMQNSINSSNTSYNITVLNNGITIASIPGRTPANPTGTCSNYFVNTYYTYTLMNSGAFVMGANTMSFIIPTAIGRANMPFSISVELI